jgi:hypothetical protein
MTELQQLAADSDAIPTRIFIRQLENQLPELRIETGPTRTTPVAEGRPPPPHQLAMPAENRLRLDQHAD